MLAELFEKMADQAVLAHGPHLVQPPGEPPYRYAYVGSDGDLLFRDVPSTRAEDNAEGVRVGLHAV